MCGIHLSVWNDPCCSHCQSLRQYHHDDDNSNLIRRGPDATNKISLYVPISDIDAEFPELAKEDLMPIRMWAHVSLQASVLQMRRELVEQPVALDLSDGNATMTSYEYYLCWNGEVYQTNEGDEVGDFGTSDTLLVAARLAEAINTDDTQTLASNIANVLSALYNAEFAVLLLRSDGTVFYGRDVWGRRSLLRWDCPYCQSFQIASTAPYMVEETHTEEGKEMFTKNEKVVEWKEIQPGMVHTASSNKTTSHPATPVPDIMQDVPLSSILSDLTIGPTPSHVSDEIWRASFQLEYHLSTAVRRRMGNHQYPTAVLFSGGLDSAVLAALAAWHCSSEMYLYNVSFGPSYDKSADRQAALVTHQTLQTQYPQKKIVFKDIIINWEDICQQEPHVRTILQPKATLMDVNIATALWFASRGGSIDEPTIAGTDHTSTESNRPRVLLLGMGADELLGGYSRHRKAFGQGGWEELKHELEMDQSRFWERNLGRDDRIVADHGREARFPFLDPHITHFLRSLPLSSICDFSLPPGQGDKRILRLLARRLGLDHASGLVKRAIQFGSRISHLSDAKRFGSRRKAKGGAAVTKPA